MKTNSKSFAALALLCVFSVSQADPRDFTLVNGTPWTIYRVHITDVTEDDWGDDILDFDETIEAGKDTFITFRGNSSMCRYDMKVVFKENVNARWDNIDLCSYSKLSIWYDYDNRRYRLKRE